MVDLRTSMIAVAFLLVSCGNAISQQATAISQPATSQDIQKVVTAIDQLKAVATQQQAALDEILKTLKTKTPLAIMIPNHPSGTSIHCEAATQCATEATQFCSNFGYAKGQVLSKAWEPAPHSTIPDMTGWRLIGTVPIDHHCYIGEEH